MKVLRGFVKILLIITLVLNLQACSSDFELVKDEIEMYVGESFNPSDYLVLDESNIEDFEITSNVDVNVPGKYEVLYELGDTKKTLYVTILGDPIIMLSTSVLIEENTAFTPKDYLHKDSLANDIKIVSNVNPKIPGDYNVVYTCGSIEKTLNVAVKKLDITLKNDNVTIDLGSTFDPKHYITLNFPNTTKLSINSNVDTSKSGDYKVTYTTSDYSKTLEVKVKDASPFLSVTETSIKQGSTFNPINYLIESDRTNRNIVIDNKVKTDVAGTYLVTYTLGTVQKTLSVVVVKSEVAAIPTPVPVPVPAPTPKPTPTPTPPPTVEKYELSVIFLTSPVSPNENATITIKGTPGEEYSITVYYKSGPSKADGLEDKIADADGEVSWTWKIGPRTSAGDWEILISGDGESISEYITVE